MRPPLALLLTLAACSSPSREPRLHRISIEGMRFVPARLTAATGDTILWVNEDVVPHTATSPGAFDSGVIPSQAAWRHVVTAPGTLAYTCTMHPTMQATLVVTP